MQDLLDFSDKTRSHQQQFWQQMCEIPTRADLKCVLMSQTNVWHTNWSGPEMPLNVGLKQKTLRQKFHSLSASGLFYQPCFFYIFVVQIRTLSWVFWISVTYYVTASAFFVEKMQLTLNMQSKTEMPVNVALKHKNISGCHLLSRKGGVFRCKTLSRKWSWCHK